MFTHGAPALKIITLALLAMLAFRNHGIAQEVKLQPLVIYEASLRQYHTAKVKTQCIEFEAITKKKWWYYLPTIGYSFGLPSISGGTNQLIQLDQQKQQNRVKLASIISQGSLDYQAELHQLRSTYKVLEIEREVATQTYVIQSIHQSIYNEAVEANEKKQIKPIEYKQALLSYQSAYENATMIRRLYVFKIIEIARFARYQFPADEALPGLDSLGIVSRQLITAPRQQK